MILDDIKKKLQEIDERVFYGMVDNSVRETVWDYIIFERYRKRINDNKTGFTDVYSVHLIREEFIPEGLEETLIAKMCEIPGMRVEGSDGEYTYIQKPNTDVVVEMFSINFVKARKKA